MIATIVGTATGFILGATLATAVVLLRGRRVACPDPEAHELSSADREAISSEFASHVTSVRRELSRYADALADGDGRLRDQLRQFEAGA